MDARYQRLKKLGEGGFGVVYLAVDRTTGRKVAIKELKDRSPDGKARFEREAVALYRQLDNPFIVDLIGHDLGHDPPYIVLEYCDRGSLRGWVGSPQPWRWVAAILVHVIEGLQSIHDAGGFHRDLKPDNLLVATAEPDTIIVKIADFGLARVPGIGSTMTRGPGGTDGYMAPEIVYRGAAYTAAADVFSLGVVATELSTGGRDPAALSRVDVPPAFRDLVLAMCAAEPAGRPAISTIARALKTLLGLVPPPPPPPPPSRSSAAPMVIGGLLLAGGVLAALAALSENDGAWDEDVRRYRGSDGRFKKG
jgi:serine/threonine protein kinase